MTPDEDRSLGRALRAVRFEHGLTQLKVAVAAGISAGQIGIWERGQVPAARGRSAHAPALTRQQFEDLAAALGCSVETIADRASLSTTTRLLYGLEPLSPARTIVAGREFDLTDAEADRVLDFMAGLVAARELGQ